LAGARGRLPPLYLSFDFDFDFTTGTTFAISSNLIGSIPFKS